jgi:hypothetical protein
MNKPLLAMALSLTLALSACSSSPSEDVAGETSEPTRLEEDSSAALQGDSIFISSPSELESVSSPFNVAGSTDYPDTQIELTAYGADGEINTEAKWHTESDGSFDFGSTYYFIGGGGEGRVEVFLVDENGEEIDRAIMPVIFE